MQIKDFVPGEECYLLTLQHDGPKFRTAKIEKVGRKYVTLTNNRRFKECGNYLIKEDCTSVTKTMLFKDRESAEEYAEIHDLAVEIVRKASVYTLRQCTLHELQLIKRILEEPGSSGK